MGRTLLQNKENKYQAGLTKARLMERAGFPVPSSLGGSYKPEVQEDVRKPEDLLEVFNRYGSEMSGKMMNPSERSVLLEYLQRQMDVMDSDTIQQRAYGGYIQNFQNGGTARSGMITRAMNIRGAQDEINKRAREMQKKASRAGLFGTIGKGLGKLVDWGGDALLMGTGLGAIPGVKQFKDYAIDPLVSGAITKEAADLGYGDKVSTDIGSRWLPGQVQDLKDYQKGVRGSFQEMGEATGLSTLGSNVMGDIKDKFGTTDIAQGAREFTKGIPGALGDKEGSEKWGALKDYWKNYNPTKDTSKYGTTDTGRIDKLLAGGSKNTTDQLDFEQGFLEEELGNFLPGSEGYNKTVERLEEITGGAWLPDRNYSHGGYVGDSLLYRVFGNKSNLF